MTENQLIHSPGGIVIQKQASLTAKTPCAYAEPLGKHSPVASSVAIPRLLIQKVSFSGHEE